MKDRLLFNRRITVDIIQKKVAEVRQVSLNNMLSLTSQQGTRKMELCKARQLSMKLSKKYTKLSLAKIGSLHGNRDHATVLNACKSIDQLIETRDSLILDDFNKLDKYLREYVEPIPAQEENIINTEK